MVSFDYWNWNWTMILHLVESRYFLINLYDPLLILNKLLIVSSYGQNLIMEVTSEVTSIIYSRYNNNLQIIIVANGLHEKCITDYNYKLRTNVYFNKWSPSKQFNYFINFGSTPSKIQFHLHSLFLYFCIAEIYIHIIIDQFVFIVNAFLSISIFLDKFLKRNRSRNIVSKPNRVSHALRKIAGSFSVNNFLRAIR